MRLQKSTSKEKSILRSYTRYLGVTFIALAVSCMFFPGSMKSTSYNVVKDILPLWGWGLLHIVTGVTCMTGASIMNGTAKTARAGISMAAALTGSWSISFVLSIFTGDSKGASGAIIWIFLTVCSWFVASHPSLDSRSGLTGDGSHGT